jgi:hypothetical protein
MRSDRENIAAGSWGAPRRQRSVNKARNRREEDSGIRIPDAKYVLLSAI